MTTIFEKLLHFVRSDVTRVITLDSAKLKSFHSALLIVIGSAPISGLLKDRSSKAGKAVVAMLKERKIDGESKGWNLENRKATNIVVGDTAKQITVNCQTVYNMAVALSQFSAVIEWKEGRGGVTETVDNEPELVIDDMVSFPE